MISNRVKYVDQFDISRHKYTNSSKIINSSHKYSKIQFSNELTYTFFDSWQGNNLKC